MNRIEKESQLETTGETLPIEVVRKDIGKNPAFKKHLIRIPRISEFVREGILDEEEARSLLITEKANDFNLLARMIENNLFDNLYGALPSKYIWKFKNPGYIFFPNPGHPLTQFYIDANPFVMKSFIKTIEQLELGGLEDLYDYSQIKNLVENKKEENIFVLKFYLTMISGNLFFTYYSKFPNKKIEDFFAKLPVMKRESGDEQQGGNKRGFKKYTFIKSGADLFDLLFFVSIDSFSDFQIADKSILPLLEYIDNLQLTQEEVYSALKYLSKLPLSTEMKTTFSTPLLNKLTDIENIDEQSEEVDRIEEEVTEEDFEENMESPRE